MHDSIYLNGGLGDVIAATSHMSPEYRKNVKTVYWGAYRGNALLAPTRKLPDFRQAEHVRLDLGDFGPKIFTLKDFKYYYDYEFDAEDWSIATKFPEIRRGLYKYHSCPYLEHKLASIKKIELPPYYIAIQGMTPANPDQVRQCRDLAPFEWRAIDRRLKLMGLKGVILDLPGGPLPVQSERFIDKRGLTLCQSIEVLKDPRCVGYWGIDSFLSILAAARFRDPNHLIVRAQNHHYHVWKTCYAAPHGYFPFVVREIR